MGAYEIPHTNEDGEEDGTVRVFDYGPFQVEVGSPLHERLVSQEKLPPGLDVEDVSELQQLTVTELREKADEFGVDTAGLKKAELVDAIVAAEAQDETL